MTLNEPPDEAKVSLLRRRWVAVAVAAVGAIAVVAILVAILPRGGDGVDTASSSSPSATLPPGPLSSGGPSVIPPTAATPPGATNGNSPSSAPAPTGSGASAPPPGDGPSIGQTAPIGQPAPVADGVSVSVGSLKAVQGESTRPGDIAAPSIQFVVTVVNSTKATISLASAVVTVDYGRLNTPASELPGPGGTTFGAELAPGQTASAVSIFSVPVAERGDVHIAFDYAAGTPIVVFRGEAPTR